MNRSKTLIGCQLNQIPPASVTHHCRCGPLRIPVNIPTINITAYLARHKYGMPSALKQRFGKGLKVTANNLFGADLLTANRVRNFSTVQ